jgi:ubiquinol-cytochrome c reductase cytochrome c subunit
MPDARRQVRRTQRRRFLFAGSLLAIAALGALALVVPAVSAQASTTDRAGKTTTLGNSIKSCGPLNLKGVSTAPNSGNPVTSTRLVCIDGALILYGNSSITYANPPASFAAAGKLLFDQTCASCHGSDANGVSPSGSATIGPNLQGVGTATVDFWVTTGRMPATDVAAVEAERKPPKLTNLQALEVAAYINSLDPSVPAVPTPHLEGANVANGASLFALNCAACHTITGAGDALAFGTNAPSLQDKKVTAQQVAEAVRIGPANMPRFSGNLSDRQVRDIVAYVTTYIQHPTNPGGAGLGGVGPVAEGFIALLLGVGGLALICFWIGERA